MAKIDQGWTVGEHGPFQRLADNLYYVDAAVPGMKLRRCMTIARMSTGALVVHNAVALGEEAMAELDALGPVEYILVPSGFHRLDAPKFHARYPEAKIVCPPGSRKKVEAIVEVDLSYADFPKDDLVQLELLDGLKGVEGVMIVSSGDNKTIVFNDALFNVSTASGGFMMKLLGSSGGPKVTRIMRLFFVKEKKALRTHLERLADLDGLKRLIPGHGEIIESEAAAVLRSVAATL